MKFTIDTKEKIIYFKEPFTKDDIEYLLSVLNIEGIESWRISMESEPAPIVVPGTTSPYTIPGDGYWWGTPTITCENTTHRFNNMTVADVYSLID